MRSSESTSDAVRRIERNSDARRDHQGVQRETHRLLQLGNEPPGDRGGIGGSAYARKDDDELIASQPCDVIGARARMPFGIDIVGRPQRVLESGRHQTQQLVAHGVAERIVDALEIVEIEIQDRELALELHRGREGARQSIAGLFTVRQAGQRVEISQFDDAMFRAPFACERDRHLANLVRMERLLQV